MLQINGSLTLLPDAVTTIDLGAATPIIVIGELILNGTLFITLGKPALDGQILTVASGPGEIKGAFTDIIVTTPKKCQEIAAKPVQSASSYTLLLEVDDGNCKSKSKRLGPGAIAGIAVGAVALVAILIAIGLFILHQTNNRGVLFRGKKKPEAFERDY